MTAARGARALGGGEQDAHVRDAAGPAGSRRDAFVIPAAPPSVGGDAAYLAGNSLGLQPRATRAAVGAELDRWEREAVRGHHGAGGWLEQVDDPAPAMARLVGARPDEVAVTGTLTVDLHLLMASFYRPSGSRTRVLMEDHAFPSDHHAVQGQVRWHGLDPETTVLRVGARPGEHCLRTEDVLDVLATEGDTLALLLLGGVNYLTGELLDIPVITAAARRAGVPVVWDLAHAAGNVALALHDWDVDAAAWCTYKYLNGGPGSTAAIFVHQRHHDTAAPRLAGWWGVATADRFAMRSDFVPAPGARGWSVSTTPVLATVPVRVALALHDEVGMTALRARSVALTGYLEELLLEVAADHPVELVTPTDPAHRGAQLSVRLLPAAPRGAADTVEALWQRHGVVADDRNPDIVRFAPAPLYSTHHDCWRAATALVAELRR